MDISRRVEPEAAVMMFDVVPAKEIDAVRPGVFQRAKARGKIRAIRERLELAAVSGQSAARTFFGPH